MEHRRRIKSIYAHTLTRKPRRNIQIVSFQKSKKETKKKLKTESYDTDTYVHVSVSSHAPFLSIQCIPFNFTRNPIFFLKRRMWRCLHRSFSLQRTQLSIRFNRKLSPSISTACCIQQSRRYMDMQYENEKNGNKSETLSFSLKTPNAVLYMEVHASIVCTINASHTKRVYKFSADFIICFIVVVVDVGVERSVQIACKFFLSPFSMWLCRLIWIRRREANKTENKAATTTTRKSEQRQCTLLWPKICINRS